MTDLPLPTLPAPLTVLPGDGWQTDGDGRVTAVAPGRTDLYVDPAGTDSDATSLLNAPTALFTPAAGDFRLSARVDVDFRATYDAGVLLVWIDEENWAKLCFEYSPGGDPMVEYSKQSFAQFSSSIHTSSTPAS